MNDWRRPVMANSMDRHVSALMRTFIEAHDQ